MKIQRAGHLPGHAANWAQINRSLSRAMAVHRLAAPD